MCCQNNAEFLKGSTPKWMSSHKLPALPINWQKTPPLFKAVLFLSLPIAAQISRWWVWRARLTAGVCLRHTGTAGDLCSHVPSQPAGTSCWPLRENNLATSKTEPFSSGSCNSEFRLFFSCIYRGFLHLLNALSANPSTGFPPMWAQFSNTMVQFASEMLNTWKLSIVQSYFIRARLQLGIKGSLYHGTEI